VKDEVARVEILMGNVLVRLASGDAHEVTHLVCAIAVLKTPPRSRVFLVVGPRDMWNCFDGL
jgi:hypothetical protein